VVDAYHYRVLIYDVSTISDGEPAVNVLGQINLNTCTAATCDASTMYYPFGLTYDSSNSRLYVADYGHNRVLIYDVSTISDGEPAVNVLGQTNLNTCNATTCNASTMNAPYGLSYDSSHSRLYVVDANHYRVLVFNLQSATWLAPENTATSTAKLTNLRLRFSVKNTGGPATNYHYRLQSATSTLGEAGDCESVATSSFSDVPVFSNCGSAFACMATSTYFNDKDSTTNQLTAPTSSTWISGFMVEDPSNQTASSTLAKDYFTEHEYVFKLTSNAGDGTTYCFRLSNSGSDLNSYTNVAKITTTGASIYSVTVSDGEITYGILDIGSSTSTLPSGKNDLQTATNNGAATETLYIKGATSTCWALASSIGYNQYVHEFSTTSGSIWVPLTTNYQVLATNVIVGATSTFDLRISAPEDTNCFGSQNVNVTVQATEL